MKQGIERKKDLRDWNIPPTINKIQIWNLFHIKSFEESPHVSAGAVLEFTRTQSSLPNFDNAVM